MYELHSTLFRVSVKIAVTTNKTETYRDLLLLRLVQPTSHALDLDLDSILFLDGQTSDQ